MIKAIDHIGIMTNDLKQSVDFYTNALGFSISTIIDREEAGFSAIFVEKDGSRIELMEYIGKKAPKRPEGAELKIEGNSIPVNDHITFSVDNIDSTVSELKEKGVRFILEPVQLEDGMKLASFKDPNGVLLELAEHTR